MPERQACGDLGGWVGYKSVYPGGFWSDGQDSSPVNPLDLGVGCGKGAVGCGGVVEGRSHPALEAAGGGK